MAKKRNVEDVPTHIHSWYSTSSRVSDTELTGQVRTIAFDNAHIGSALVTKDDLKWHGGWLSRLPKLPVFLSCENALQMTA
jgi:hypothetical protein